MGNRDLTAESFVLTRIWGYLEERFPPVVYTILVALFVGSAAVASGCLAHINGQVRWEAALVVLLVFFHLRVFDEHKDHAEDLVAHPDRLLSRGVVTLPLLRKCAIAAIVLEAALSLWMGTNTLIWWAAAMGFSLLMAFEFGVGSWLRGRVVLYALTHNPITGLLAVYAWASTGLPFVADFGWYIAAVSFGALAFEIGRKMRLPGEEQDGVSTYSAALGRKKAGWLLAGCIVMTAVLGTLCVEALGSRTVIANGILSGAGGLALWAALFQQPAKTVEMTCSTLLLLTFVAIGVAAF